MRTLVFCWLLGGQALLHAGARARVTNQLKLTCTRCHSFDVVRAQRLSRAEWEEELAKMSRMGAKIENREAVLDYLSEHYGPARLRSGIITRNRAAH
ncbi:MAG TPA: hypothetical protein VFA33_03280 [Bryobacteraceae bacterium]|nr:hypothetical protein [Bryobacteraceae bacterium]